MKINKVFEDSLFELAKKYKNMVLLSSDSSRITNISDFTKSYEARHFNFGKGVRNLSSAAVGFTVRGKIPVISGMSIYSIAGSFEQIRNDICYSNLNVKIIGSYFGFNGEGFGAGYKFTEDIALMRALPNMKVMMPADYFEAGAMMREMMKNFGPCYLRMPGEELPVLFNAKCKFKFGTSHVVREGKDLCIFAIGPFVSRSLEIAEKLFNEGIDVMVVNLSSIKPIDEKTVIECSKKVKKCVTVEDHNIIGGIGSAVSEVLCENNPCPLKRLGLRDVFVQSGEKDDLYKKYGLDEESIIGEIKAFML